jgi:hypothetical protein
MLAGKISVAEARARYGGKYGKQAAAGMAKSAEPSLQQVWENHSDPQIRERTPMVVKSAQGTAGNVAPPVRPAPAWTGLDDALLRQSREHPDPAQRESARQALEQRGRLAWAPGREDKQVRISVSPELRGHLQLPGGMVI